MSGQKHNNTRANKPWQNSIIFNAYRAVAPCVLLPGDPARVEIIASHWDEAHKVTANREYVTYTGMYKAAPISCMSTGIGCPSTAIGVEELARCGATTFLSVGTGGTYQEHVKVGELAIFDPAVC